MGKTVAQSENLFIKSVYVLALLVVAVAARAGMIAGDLTRFPGVINELASPNRRYVARNVDSAEEPHHLLEIAEVGGGIVASMRYSRFVDVLWSPDSAALLVNDHAGSDFSRCFVFAVTEKPTRTDVGALILETFKDDRRLRETGHRYIEGTAWVDTRTLRVKVAGYGASSRSGFEAWFSYVLGESVKRLS
jgi:hypothetical protein